MRLLDILELSSMYCITVTNYNVVGNPRLREQYVFIKFDCFPIYLGKGDLSANSIDHGTHNLTPVVWRDHQLGSPLLILTSRLTNEKMFSPFLMYNSKSLA